MRHHKRKNTKLEVGCKVQYLKHHKRNCTDIEQYLQCCLDMVTSSKSKDRFKKIKHRKYKTMTECGWLAS